MEIGFYFVQGNSTYIFAEGEPLVGTKGACDEEEYSYHISDNVDDVDVKT